MNNSETFFTTTIAIAIILLCGACASGHQPPPNRIPPVIRDPAVVEQRLHTAVATGNALRLDRIGQVHYDDFEVPVWIVRLTHRPETESNILITAGVHGNEPAGVECALRLVELLARAPNRFGAHNIEIVPLVNPWGWAHDTRFNRQGIDINRDFASFKSQEALIISGHLQHNRYRLIIDLHEDPAAHGFYLYQYGRSDKAAVEPVVAALAAQGYPVEQDIKMVALKTRNGIIDAPMWGLWYMKITHQLSITNYARLYNCLNVFTIETPTVLDWEDRLQIQHQALAMLMDTFEEQNEP
jgi:hypothetical protein